MQYHLNDWFFGWGWILWLGFIFLMVSSFGNWNYTYRAHRKYAGRPDNRAFDILDERYARGEITREQYGELKSDIGDVAINGSGGLRGLLNRRR